MTHTSVLADRSARAALSLLAGLNILFVLALLIGLAAGARQARADDLPVCTGRDLLAEMAADKPDEMARLRAEADAIPNGKGILWRIEGPAGTKPSFLLGTMHVSDPRVTALDPAAQAAYAAAGTVVIETTDVLDQAKMAGAIAAHPELMMFTDDTTLSGILPEADRAAVEEGLARRGLTLDALQKMKPWVVASLVGVPACEMARKAAGAPVLDIKLAEEAKAAGKSVEGLETMIDQLEAMASLPIGLHVQGLVDTLKLGDGIDDLNETMVRIYKSGDTGLFWPFFEAVMPADASEETSYAAFQEAMIDARNRTMAEAAGPILDKGGAFMAVGALHLAGEQGLVALLRQQGYAVEPAE